MVRGQDLICTQSFCLYHTRNIHVSQKESPHRTEHATLGMELPVSKLRNCCMHAKACDGQQASFSIALCLTILRQCLSLNWNLTFWLGWCMISAAHCSSNVATGTFGRAWLFTCVLGFKFKSSNLLTEHSSLLSHYPSHTMQSSLLRNSNILLCKEAR